MKTADLNDLHRRDGLPADPRVLFEPLGSMSNGSSINDGPIPFDDSFFNRFPVEALGPVLGGAVKAAVEIYEVPDALPACVALGYAALAVQGHIDVSWHPALGPAPTSLAILINLESGERKSAIYRRLGRRLRRMIKRQSRAHQDALEAYQNDLEAWECSRRAVKNKNKGDRKALAAALNDLGPRPEKPRDPNMLVSDATREGLFKRFREGPYSQAYMEDEAAIWVGGCAMTREKMLASVAALSKYWDGSSQDRARASEDYILIDGRRLTFSMAGQPDVLSEVINDKLVRAQGFTSRLLISQPAPRAGDRKGRPPKPWALEALMAYDRAMEDILSRPLPEDGDGEGLDPRPVHYTEEAAAAIEAFRVEVEVQLGRGGALEEVKDVGAKIAEHAARLGAVIAYFAFPGLAELCIEDAQRGIEVARYFLVEQLRVRGICAMPQRVKDAKDLLAWAHEKGRDLLTPRDIRRNLRAFRDDAERLEEAIAELEGRGWIAFEASARVDGRLARRAYRVTKMSP